MKRTLYTAFAAALLWGGGLPEASAQSFDRAGTAAMEELAIPITPRSIALGSGLSAGITGMNAVEAYQANPAASLVGTNTSAMFSRTDYIDDTGINYAGVSQRFGANSVSLTLSTFDYGDIPLTTENQPEADPTLTYSASSYVVSVGYARQFTDRIGAGFAVKGLGRTIYTVNSGGVAADAGITYQVPESGLRFGISLQNIGSALEFSGEGLTRDQDGTGPGGVGSPISVEIEDIASDLPVALSAGGSFTRQVQGDVSVTGLASYRSVAYDADQFSGGVELGYRDLAFVRGGVNVSSDGNDTSAWEVWNIGAGLNLPLGSSTIAVDYAYRPSDVFGGVNMFSVGVNL